MHIADVDQRMLGANGIGTLAMAVGQIAAVSTDYGAVTIAGQSQMSIVSLARTQSGQNVTIGQSGVGKPVTNSFVNMAYAMLVGIGLVYLVMVILFRWLLVPFVIVRALPLAGIGAFVVLAVIGHATNIITGLAVSLQATALPDTVIAVGIWIAYSVDGGLYGVALAAAAILVRGRHRGRGGDPHADRDAHRAHLAYLDGHLVHLDQRDGQLRQHGVGHAGSHRSNLPGHGDPIPYAAGAPGDPVRA